MNGVVLDPRRKVRHKAGKTEPAPEVEDTRTPEQVAADDAAASERLKKNKTDLAVLNEQRREVRSQLEARIAGMVDEALENAGKDYRFADLSARCAARIGPLLSLCGPQLRPRYLCYVS